MDAVILIYCIISAGALLGIIFSIIGLIFSIKGLSFSIKNLKFKKHKN